MLKAIKINLSKNQILLLCLSLLVLLIHIRYIGSIGIFTVLDDEFGYWGIAAYLAGFDWSDAVSKIPYYSYGYSLLLVPLFWIFENPIHMYKAAIFLNGLMISASFLLCYDIARKLSREANPYILMAIAFLISMYPTYIAYSNIAWSECLLIFVCWLLTWCFVDLDKQSNNYKFLLIGFLSIYVYVIHQRALGVLIASILVIFLMKMLNKINLKQFLMVIIPIIFLLIVHFYLKDYIQTNVWLNNYGNLTNDYSAQANKIKQIFTIDGFPRFIKVFLGQFFYIGAATYLLGYFGLYELIHKIGVSLNNFLRTKKAAILNQDINFYPYTFLVLAIISSFAISVIFMINPTRIDQIVYGRYIDMIMGPIMLLGILNLSNKNLNLSKIIIGTSICFSLLTVGVYSIIQTSGLTKLVLQNAVGLLFMSTPLNIFLPALIAIYFITLIYRSFHKKKYNTLINLILISSLFFITGERFANYLTDINKEIFKITCIVTYINNNGELPVYFLWNDQISPEYDKWDNQSTDDRRVADHYQFLLKDEPLKLVNKEELAKIKEHKFVLIVENKYLNELSNDYEIAMSNQYSYLLVSKNNK